MTPDMPTETQSRGCLERPVRLRARAGYYLDEVPAVHCLMCGRPIGIRPYREVRILARFGQMLFAHQQCEEPNHSLTHL